MSTTTPPTTTYAITGANRGLGLGLVKTYLSRPNTSVIAIVRNSSGIEMLREAVGANPNPSPNPNPSFQWGSNSHLYAVEVDLSSAFANAHAGGSCAPESIRERVLAATPITIAGSGTTAPAPGITHINTLICGAGTVTPLLPALSVTASQLRECVEVNTLGPLVMFQALWPLMEKKKEGGAAPPKFFVISSSVGSIGCIGMSSVPMPGGAYGPSKAAVNYLVRSLHDEMGGDGENGDGLVSVAVHPGWVRTGMGESAARYWGLEEMVDKEGLMVVADDAVRYLVETIDGATRESVGGKFVVAKGGVELPW